MAKKKASAKKVQTKKKSTQASKAAPKKVAKPVAKKAKAKAPAKKIVKKAVKKVVAKAKTKKAVVKSPAKSIAKSKAKSSKATAKKEKPVKKAISKTVKASKVKKTEVSSKGGKKSAVKSQKTVSAPKNKMTPALVPQIKASKNVAASKVKDFMGKLQPLDDRILVSLHETEKMTAGGLYIPDTVSDVSGNVTATVVAVGRGHQNKKGHVKNMDVQVGDKVVFSEYAGSKVTLEGSELVMLRETEVLGIVSK